MPHTTKRPRNVYVQTGAAKHLDALTKATRRSKKFLTFDAAKESSQVQSWQIQDIVKGIAEADRGEFASDAEVGDFFVKWSN